MKTGKLREFNNQANSHGKLKQNWPWGKHLHDSVKVNFKAKASIISYETWSWIVPSVLTSIFAFSEETLSVSNVRGSSEKMITALSDADITSCSPSADTIFLQSVVTLASIVDKFWPVLVSCCTYKQYLNVAWCGLSVSTWVWNGDCK